MPDSCTKQARFHFLVKVTNGSYRMNHIYLSTIPIRSFDVAFLTLSLGTFFHFVMTMPVMIISVGRKLLQKFCSVIFICPLYFVMLLSTVNLVIVVNDLKKLHDIIKCL